MGTAGGGYRGEANAKSGNKNCNCVFSIFIIAVDKPAPGRLPESIYMYTFPRRQQLSHSHPLRVKMRKLEPDVRGKINHSSNNSYYLLGGFQVAG